VVRSGIHVSAAHQGKPADAARNPRASFGRIAGRWSRLGSLVHGGRRLIVGEMGAFPADQLETAWRWVDVSAGEAA
jgi:hypothetical protein